MAWLDFILRAAEDWQPERQADRPHGISRRLRRI
jgi:hypothetical protein